MNDNKIDYLKKQLEKALEEGNFGEINTCYLELTKYVSASDIPELAKRVSDYNREHSDNQSQKKRASTDDTKQRIRFLNEKREKYTSMQRIGVGGGTGVMVLGLVFVLGGAGVFGLYNDFLTYFGVAVAIIGFIMVIAGAAVAGKNGKINVQLIECRKEVFKIICENENKLKYLDRIESYSNQTVCYMGQINDDEPDGFGVALLRDGTIYVGEWEKGDMSGIGKFVFDDMSITLEGVFSNDKLNGETDVQWEDGCQWHGEYKNGLPWNGKGKTIVNGKVKEGVWKNGMIIS